MAKCDHDDAQIIECQPNRLQVICRSCGASCEVGIPPPDRKGFHAPPKWVIWAMHRELYKYRKTAAFVDARTWIAAKGKAGLADAVYAI